MQVQCQRLLVEKEEEEKCSSVSITTPLHLLIYLSGHDDHPDQEDESNDPECKDSIPFVADCVLFQPGERVEGDAVDFVVRDVGIAGCGDVALSVNQQVVRSSA